MELIMASTTETSTLEGGDVAQDAALASSIRREVMVPRRRSMREAIERACARGEARIATEHNVKYLVIP